MKRFLLALPLIACLSGAGTFVESELSSVQAMDKALKHPKIATTMTLWERGTDPFVMIASVETEPSGTQTVEIIGGPPNTDSGVVVCTIRYDLYGDQIEEPTCRDQ